MKDRATIFDIKRFAVGDGPGIRTTVFFKGCPLRCAWCHNPEGLDSAPQLMHEAAKCTGCGLCRVPCGHDDCAPWERCLHVCPQNALKVAGRTVTADELADVLLRDAEFLRSVGGGVTFSGGEPLMQAEFLAALMPVLCNGLIIGPMLYWMYGGSWILNILTVAAGEAAACFLLGVPLIRMLEKNPQLLR